MHPLVSVIVPVYNTSKYLRQCLDSIQAQTLKEIEIICVDDGSTDDSMEILLEKDLQDPRIHILQQKNKGGGAARNLGMSVAKGKYLAFLDSDDFFKPTMLEEAVASLEKTNADITVFQYRLYYENLDLTSRRIIGLSLRDNSGDMPLLHEMSYDKIFSFTPPNPWNKLYRHSFVLENNLQFQEIKKCNDVYFVLSALYLAEKIAILRKPLVYYRTGTGKNTQATTFERPLDAYHAFSAVQMRLSATPDWDLGERYFVSEALSHIIIQLRKLESKHKQEHQILLQTLLDGGFDVLGVSKYGKENYQNTWAYRKYQRYRGGKQTGRFLETMYYAENVVCYVRGLIRNSGFCGAMKDTWYVTGEKLRILAKKSV